MRDPLGAGAESGGTRTVAYDMTGQPPRSAGSKAAIGLVRIEIVTIKAWVLSTVRSREVTGRTMNVRYANRYVFALSLLSASISL
jgi:hypothetical protein